MSADGAQRGAQAVYRAMSILETFGEERSSLTLAEIAAAVQLTQPTALRLLRALKSHDLVVFDAPSRRYSLGPGVVRMASIVFNRGDMLSIVQPRVQRLREQTKETAALHWRVDARRVCLIEVVSPQPVRMASGLGNSYPLVAGAAGKAMLAHMSTEEVDLLVEQARAEGRAVDRRKLVAELAEIQRQRYATSVGETVPGAAAVATAIVDPAGRAIAALNVTGPADRLTAHAMKAIAPSILEAADEIMVQFGVGVDLPLG